MQTYTMDKRLKRDGNDFESGGRAFVMSRYGARVLGSNSSAETNIFKRSFNNSRISTRI